MAFIFLAAYSGASLSYFLSAIWSKWWQVVIWVFAGVVAAFVLAGLVAAALHFFSPLTFPAEDVLARVLGFAPHSFLISPVAAFLGWRQGREEKLDEKWKA